MDGRAASARDKADDLVAGHRVTALRHDGEHAFQPHHFNRIGGGASRRGRIRFEDVLALFILRELLDDLARGKVAVADFDEHLIGSLETEFTRQVFEIEFGDAQALEFAFERFASLCQVLLVFLLLEPGFDLGACPRCADESEVDVQPVAAGSAAFRRQNFELVAGL